MNSNRNIYRISAFLFICLLLQSCSIERFIPEGELIYEGATVKVESDTLVEDLDLIKNELDGVVRPEPNSKFLGMRPGLYFHYKAQREKPGFINKFFNKKIGEEPVYASDVQPYEVEQILLNRLENNGFFYSSATSVIEEDPENKEAKAVYNLRVKDPYVLKTYQLDTDSLLVYQGIKTTLDKTIIKPEMRFDLGKMKVERDRIDTELKKKGYYNFNPGFLIFESDTNQYEKKNFDLYLRLKNDVPTKSIVPYKIGRVNVYPNYTVEQDSILQDTTKFENKNFFQDEEFFLPKRLDPFILIEKGQYYDPDVSRSTSRRLGSIGAYKFINIQYDELDTGGSDSLGLLEANIFLSPLNKRAIRTELQAVTKSNSFSGPTLALTFSNRNLFKGGELLNVSAKFGYEVQISGGDQSGLSSIQAGISADLIFPRLLFPISFDEDWFKYNIPKTKVSLGVDYLNRSQLFSLGSILATFGYTWQANRYVTHALNPISLNYVKFSNTDEFQEILDDNPFLQSSFDQQFISGLTYSFTYNGMVDVNKRHQFFINANFDTAGNSISLFSGGASGDEPQEFLGLEYAQYAKVDADMRYHLNLGNDQKIATRLFAGIGKPYGNSDVLPYTKQYFSGGPYSVRAFGTRSLGPGTYNADENSTGETSYFDQTGNIRLEANIEYRFPLINVVKGAFFVDAGNVWNTSDNVNSIPEGKFTSDFINELGIGAGFGVRVDIQSFVIRLDLAAPWHDPSQPEGERWNFDVSNPVLNFAIGYPF